MTQSVSQVFLSNAQGGTGNATGAFSSGLAGYRPAFLSWTDDAGIPQEFICFVKTEDYDYGADVTDHPVETGSNVTDNVRVKLREAKIFFFETNSPIDSNHWAQTFPNVSIITVPGPPPTAPPGPLAFNAWNNLITEKALGATAAGFAGGLIGGAAGGNSGNALGGAIGTVAGSVVADVLVGGGVPVAQVVPPPAAGLFGFTPPTTIQTQTLGFLNATGSTSQDFVSATIALLEQLLNDVQVVTLNGPKLTITSMVINSIHIHRDAEVGDAAEIEVGLKEIRFVSTTTVPSPAPAVIRSSAPVNKGELGVSDLTDPQAHSVAVSLFATGGLFSSQGSLFGLGSGASLPEGP